MTIKTARDTSAELPAFERAKDQLFAERHADLNFTGCGIGFRRRAGQITDELAVIAMVARKLPAGFVASSRLLPSHIDVEGRRCAVDVVQIGRPKIAATGPQTNPLLSGPLTGVVRPPLMGCSISDVDASATSGTGTLGCYVTDLTDGSVAILSSNHVLANLGRAAAGKSIIQPALQDAGGTLRPIAALKRSVNLATAPAYVDAALATLNSGITPSTAVLDNLMPPISATHQAVGIVTSVDDGHINCFVSRMDRALTGLNARIYGDTTAGTFVAVPQPGMTIEKVGRTSGYTSSVIDAVSVSVTVAYDASQSYVLNDMIWTQAFNALGDSGAVVCVGGNGETFVPQPQPNGCAILGSLGTYYNLPLTNDNDLTNEAQSAFLSLSRTGNLLISLVYLNSGLANTRLAGQQANSTEQAYAHTYYTKYRDFIADQLADPNSTATVTQDNLHDMQLMVLGLSSPVAGPTPLTPAEGQVLTYLFNNVVRPTLGMNRTQLIAYLNDPTVYSTVRSKITSLPEIRTIGTPTAS